MFCILAIFKDPYSRGLLLDWKGVGECLDVALGRLGSDGFEERLECCDELRGGFGVGGETQGGGEHGFGYC